MENKFFGDRHDFYKYFFLKKVVGGHSLGIDWCLVPDEKKGRNGQTQLTDYEKSKDAELYNFLLENRGNIASLEPFLINRYLNKVSCFKTLHQNFYEDYKYEEAVVQQLRGQDVIFFDPDNGIEVASTNNKNKYKYVSYRLLSHFWNMGKSLIIFQFNDMQKNSLTQKLEIIEKTLIQQKPGCVDIVKRGSVNYICLIDYKHDFMLKNLASFGSNKEYKIKLWKNYGGIG